MTSYLATVTVLGDLSPEEIDGMADALGASSYSDGAGRVVLRVPGEAPDLESAVTAARGHAAEVLDGYSFTVDVDRVP